MNKNFTLLLCLLIISSKLNAQTTQIIPSEELSIIENPAKSSWKNEIISYEIQFNNENIISLVKKNNIHHIDTTKKSIEQEIKNLSKQKWDWMSDKNIDSLNLLFNENCNFVHMGGTWGKDREIDIIKNGFIWYKKAEIYTSSAEVFGNMVVLLTDIDLIAIVGGKEAINPFMVTEVYFKENNHWKLGQLTFSHLARSLKLKTNSQQPQ